MKNKTILIIFFSLISLIPISNYSLWIDESTTAYFASKTNITDLNEELFSATTSEVQMPGYIYYMWAWEKLFGHNEFMLRLSNLPFIVILLIVIAFSHLTDRMKLILSFFISFSPFLWSNLNEARCTIPLYSLGGILLVSLLYYFSGIRSLQKKGVWIFTFSLIVGVSFNMLFLLYLPVLAFLFLLHSIYGKYKFMTLLKDWWLGLCLMVILISPFLVYFLWSLSRVTGAYTEPPSFLNIAYVFYEFLGFSGIGPPRNVLRESQSFETIKPYLPLLILFVSTYILLFIFIFRSFWKQSKTRQIFFNPYFVTFVFGILVFSLVSLVFKFRFWGRHAEFLYPLLVFYFSQMIDRSWNVESLKYKFLIPVLPLFVLMLISDINLRFKTYYQKENNKEASIKAIEHIDNQGIILWNGHDHLAAYYGLKIINNPLKIPKTWPIYRNAVIPPYTSGLSDYLNSFRGKNSVLVVLKRWDYDKKGFYQDYIINNGLSILFTERDYTIYSMQ